MKQLLWRKTTNSVRADGRCSSVDHLSDGIPLSGKWDRSFCRRCLHWIIDVVDVFCRVAASAIVIERNSRWQFPFSTCDCDTLCAVFRSCPAVWRARSRNRDDVVFVTRAPDTPNYKWHFRLGLTSSRKNESSSVSNVLCGWNLSGILTSGLDATFLPKRLREFLECSVVPSVRLLSRGAVVSKVIIHCFFLD